MLLWSCMGSGGIGLPYLDKELNESMPGRLRFYGHLNDGEFARECARRGVLAFAVVWNAQLWEFPAEFDDDEAELKALNIPRGDGEPAQRQPVGARSGDDLLGDVEEVVEVVRAGPRHGPTLTERSF